MHHHDNGPYPKNLANKIFSICTHVNYSDDNINPPPPPKQNTHTEYIGLNGHKFIHDLNSIFLEH